MPDMFGTEAGESAKAERLLSWVGCESIDIID
jgi:hypothetical protein